MVWLIKWLWLGHIHQWKILSWNKVMDINDHKKTFGTKFLLQCEHCGDLKMKYFDVFGDES